MSWNSNNSTNYMTINDMQILISGKQNVATKTKPIILKIPPKYPTHLTKKNTTPNHTEKLE